MQMLDSTICSECGRLLDDLADLPSGERSPCPNCGSTRRTVGASCVESANAHDYFSALGTREGKPFTYGESLRQDGRAASADRNNDGSFSFSISGSSPKNEEHTLDTCKRLVRHLNSNGGNWSDPIEGEGYDDCVADDNDNPKRTLRIQVVRASVDRTLWKGLNNEEEWAESNLSPSALASRMWEAIEHKAREIYPNARGNLTLALDATLLPAFAFAEVIAEFRARHSGFTQSLGFVSVWIVGPSFDELIQRLD